MNVKDEINNNVEIKKTFHHYKVYKDDIDF